MASRIPRRVRIFSLAALAVLAFTTAGCSETAPAGGAAPSGPTGPSITAISPTRGSTGGDTTLRITATGVQPGVVVTIDNASRPVTIVSATTLQVTTSAHASGAVDVAVRNVSGQVSTLAGGYTFAPPDSFDFNGTWSGSALAHPESTGRTPQHADMAVRFIIQGNHVISVACGYSVVDSPLARPLPVSNGEFASTESGAKMSGRVVSDTGAIGTIDTSDCPGTRWSATKQ